MPRMTQQQADAHQARLAMGRGHSRPLSDAEMRAAVDRFNATPLCSLMGSTTRVHEEKESELHQQIRNECSRRGWLCFSGAMHKRTWRTSGEPDFVIARDGSTVLWMEAKTRTGKLSDDQINVKEKMATLGHTVHVVRNFGEFLEIIK